MRVKISKRWNNFPLAHRMGEGRGEGISGFILRLHFYSERPGRKPIT
jgi:hypothetical protein